MSSRPATNRPTHIPLPAPYARTSPTPNGSGSPSATPGPTQPLASPTSPRNSFLPNFMRNRSRAATITGRAASPRVEQSDPMQRAAPTPARNGDGGGVTRSVSTPNSGGLAAPAPSGPPIDPKGKTHRLRLVPHLETSRSLAFDPVVRELYPISVVDGLTPSAAAASVTTLGPLVNGKPPALLLKVGRFTDKTPAPAEAGSSDRPATGIGGATITIAGGGGETTNTKVAFKSKVVSRAHAEIWCEAGGKFFIKDTASSSGTFLNHIRLSSPNTESRPTQLNDGDVLQLGVDYQGGHEDMFRCVKMRVEVGRDWQRGANEFNTNALKQLKALGPATPEGKGKAADTPSKKLKASVTDCCICLFSVTVCQSLFIAPCSHVFHYKCIRPLLMQHHPGFSCPLCRTFANLEEDVETEEAWELASRRASVISRRPSHHSIRLPRDASQHPGTDAVGEPSSGVGFGAAAASVDELLGSGTNSDEGGRTEEEGRTATGDATGDVDMSAPRFNRQNHPTISITPIPVRTTSASAGSSRRSSAQDPMPTAAILDVNTPMNDYFLSTLALGPSVPESADTTGVHQRLETVGTIPEEGGATPAAERERREETAVDGV